MLAEPGFGQNVRDVPTPTAPPAESLTESEGERSRFISNESFTDLGMLIGHVTGLKSCRHLNVLMCW